MKKQAVKTAVSVALIAAFIFLFFGCETKNGIGETSADAAATAMPQCTREKPVTLEQALLLRRGMAYGQSDYQKLPEAEGIIDITTEFDSQIDYGYSKDDNCIFLSGGLIYRANFHTLLSNGKHIQEIGKVPVTGDTVYWHFTRDGETGIAYGKDGIGYLLHAQSADGPYRAEKSDSSEYAPFSKIFGYASDGKALEDHTAAYWDFDKLYNYGTPMIAFIGEKISLLFPGKFLDRGTKGWNWYRDMGGKEYIAFELDLSAIGEERPIRLFNNNIVMTDCAFYEIIYATKPLSENDSESQLAPDGSVSPYYPAATHLNCNLTLRKLDLLSTYYKDVRNICTSHVITSDYTLLPIREIITEGYDEYHEYTCTEFYWDYMRRE